MLLAFGSLFWADGGSRAAMGSQIAAKELDCGLVEWDQAGLPWRKDRGIVSVRSCGVWNVAGAN